MKLILVITFIFCFSIANAQLAPGGEFKTTYTRELKSFETQLNAGKQMEAERSYRLLIQMQQKHKKQLEALLKTTTDREENAEVAERIMDEDTRAVHLKELSMDMLANRQEIIEEMKDFLEE